MSPVRLVADDEEPPEAHAPERASGRPRLPFIVCLALWIVAGVAAWGLIVLALRFI